MMYGWDYSQGCSYGGYLGYIFMFFIVVLLGVGIYLIVRSSQGNSATALQPDDTLAILKKRYAAGEIDKKEFDEKKKAIAT